MKAIFDLDRTQVANAPEPRVSLRYVKEFMLDGETPGRVLNDQGVRCYVPFLRGSGRIVELGAGGDYYRNFVPGQAYETTNAHPPCDRIVDMTAMPYDDNSVDAFISMFALEHVYDYQTAIDEMHRCLKPGGRLLLGVPWMYYYHAAPDDFFRFSVSALDKMLRRFDMLKRVPFGNRNLLVCQLFHEKRALGHKGPRWLMRLRRLLVLPLLVSGLLGTQNDPIYAVVQLCLCEKPS